MKLSLAEVEHVADLARLALTAAEKDRFREQLSSILAYAERLVRLAPKDPVARQLRTELGGQ